MNQTAITRILFAGAFTCILLTATAQADVAKASIKGASVAMGNTATYSSASAATISARQFQLAYPKVWAHLQGLQAPADSHYEIVEEGILVSFAKGNQNTQAAYSHQQRLNYWVTEIPASALPAEVTRPMKQYYAGYTITNARHITNAQGLTSYRLVAENAREMVEIILQDGELYTAGSYHRR